MVTPSRESACNVPDLTEHMCRVSSRGAAEQGAPVDLCLFAKVSLQGSLLCDLAAACVISQLDRTGGKPFDMDKPSVSREYPAAIECNSIVCWSISVGSWYGGKSKVTYATSCGASSLYSTHFKVSQDGGHM